MPVAAALQKQDSGIAGNLVQNGSFEQNVTGWQVVAGAKFRRIPKAAATGNFGAEAVLPGPAAVSREITNTCPVPLNNAVYTFALRARTNIGEAVVGRIVSKDANNQVLEMAASTPLPGDDQWHQLVVSAQIPPRACSVSIDIANTTSASVAVSVDDAIFVRHPGTIDKAGNVRFQSADAAAQR
jgi:hypothetical protein